MWPPLMRQGMGRLLRDCSMRIGAGVVWMICAAARGLCFWRVVMFLLNGSAIVDVTDGLKDVFLVRGEEAGGVLAAVFEGSGGV